MTAPCALCGSAAGGPVAGARRRLWRCGGCRLVSADPGEWPTPAAERERYAKHRNDPADPGYAAFLDRLAGPLAARLAPGARGLDYGCGPVPALGGRLGARGFPCAAWDPQFTGGAAPAGPHDFVTLCEVLEHLREPRADLGWLAANLRSGGWLAAMTLFWDGETDWETWHYLSDPTHIRFWHRSTLDYVAEEFGFTIGETADHRVALLRRR